MKSQIELLPCPFCGKKFSRAWIKASGIVWKGTSSEFECSDCGATGPLVTELIPKTNGQWTDEQAQERDRLAADAWNRRAR